MSQDFSTPTRTMNNVKTAKDFALLNAQDHHPGQQQAQTDIILNVLLCYYQGVLQIWGASVAD